MIPRLQPPLPSLTSLDEAIAVCDAQRDDFFLDAFLIQGWIRHLGTQAAAEYAGKPKASQRALQMSQAQCAFLRVFGHSADRDLHLLLQSLYRYTEYRDPTAELLGCALTALALEHEVSGDLTGTRAVDQDARPLQAIALIRGSIERWCDWLDAVVHLGTHAEWSLSPESVRARSRQWDLEPASALRRASTAAPRPGPAARAVGGNWTFQEVDEAIISLWPLVKRHGWTYGDLLGVLRDVLRRPEVHPCRCEQSLANYCTQVLGLRQTLPQKRSRSERPAGYELAIRLCPAVREPHAPGLPPWTGIKPEKPGRGLW
jgi:hypothetical protein